MSFSDLPCYFYCFRHLLSQINMVANYSFWIECQFIAQPCSVAKVFDPMEYRIIVVRVFGCSRNVSMHSSYCHFLVKVRLYRHSSHSEFGRFAQSSTCLYEYTDHQSWVGSCLNHAAASRLWLQNWLLERLPHQSHWDFRLIHLLRRLSPVKKAESWD